ncbi:MAG: LysM peptidoglycan-binding domain-containing protein, partial [Deltaproteobacteria bacterium]|nr:LysM peptidoglycan-binding domain-containing protein [Deltaproteobacteria bacterium]
MNFDEGKNPMVPYRFRCIFYAFCVFVPVLLCAGPSQAQEEEKSYSISLTKTAEKQGGTEIHEVDNRKVLTQEYTVQDGDHVWQLFRERGLLQKRNLPELLSVLKKMNKSLDNIDLIHPGQKIIIPLKIAPVAGGPTQEETVQFADLKDIDFRDYTVRKDDSVIKVIKGMYRVPEDDLYKDYLQLVRKMNPDIKELDSIYPGQSIRLPVYSPEVIRVPIKAAKTKKPGDRPKRDVPKTAKASQKPNPIAHDLAAIFIEMGEEWIQSGEHFIPLKTGGQINLKAEAFPIINLKKGHRVIVDLDSNLPPKMGRLIESSWNNYGVVHLTKDDDLKSSLDKTLMACNFPKVLKSGESLEIGKDIPIKITGDWIVTVPGAGSENRPGFVVINLRDADNTHTPLVIKNYLEGFGVKVIDYPPSRDEASVGTGEVETLKGGGDPSALLKTILGLTGQSYTTDKNIPVYQSRNEDLNLIIRADFFLKVKGKDAVISLAGLEPEVVSLLEDQGFMVLSLAKEKDTLNLVARTCEFLGIQFQRRLHDFMAVKKDVSGNIRLTLTGVIFSDSSGDSTLATQQNLP